MNNKLVKGLVIIAAGSLTAKVVTEIRNRKLQKDMYEEAEVVEDENANKE